MHTKTKLGLLLAAVATSAFAGALAGGCSDDPVVTKPTDDSGTKADATGGTDGATTDGAKPDATPEAGPPKAKALAVHAAYGLPAVRFCFAVGSKDDGSDGVVSPLPALPYDDAVSTAAGLPFPALFPGTGGALPDTGTDLSNLAVTPYFINAATIKAEVKSNAKLKTCNDLLSGKEDAGAVSADKFWKLPTLPKGTFAAGKTVLILGVGCPAGFTEPGLDGGIPSECGGTLKTVVVNLDNVTKDAAKIGYQAINVSYAIDSVAKATGSSLEFSVGSLTADGGIDLKTVVPGTAGAGLMVEKLLPTTAAPTDALPATPDFTKLFVAGGVRQADGGYLPGVGGPFLVPQALADTYVLTTGDRTLAGLPAYWKSGQAYTAVVVGSHKQPPYIDPVTGGPLAADAGGVFNGRVLHFLVFPNDPVIPKFQ